MELNQNSDTEGMVLVFDARLDFNMSATVLMLVSCVLDLQKMRRQENYKNGKEQGSSTTLIVPLSLLQL